MSQSSARVAVSSSESSSALGHFFDDSQRSRGHDRIRLSSVEMEIESRARAIVLVGTGKDRLKSSRNRRIELTLDCLSKPHSRDLAGHRVTVRAIRSHRVVRIRDTDDPREKGNLVTKEAIGIPLPIYPLVVMPDNLCDLSV